MGIRIGFPLDEQELTETIEMTARSFRGSASKEAVAEFRGNRKRPGFRPRLQRILKLNGRIVAGALIVDKKMRLGQSVLRCGGIADVATDPDWRHRGLGRRMMDHSIEFMTRQRYDVSLLFGIEDYYHKFGYRPAGCESHLTLALSDAGHAGAGPLKASAIKRSDLPEVARLRASTDRNVPVTFDRPLAYWQHLWPRIRTARVIRDPRGKLLAAWQGHVAEGVYEVREVVAEPRVEVMSAVIAHCSHFAQRDGADRIRFHISHDHPFASCCLEWGAELCARYPRNSGCMVRFLNLRSAFTKLLPEFSARLCRASAAHHQRTLTFDTDLGENGLIVSASGVSFSDRPQPGALQVRLDQGRLAQLVCGYRGVDDLRQLPDVRIDAEAVPLLRVLFPTGCPYIWPGDRF